MWIKLLYIGAGGFLGAALRYFSSGWIQKCFPQSFFPWGTLFVNILGCLLIGFFMGLVNSKQMFSPEIRLLILVGGLGSFTTFSTFAYESLMLLRDGQLLMMALNIGVQAGLGLFAVYTGLYLSRLI
ncbi:MAG: fluoride efflux transporter CrcB [candidate division KSB1 bacterium]|nr:fluoride efflux transporter CrcB [candidate division KSB1 bacterium]